MIGQHLEGLYRRFEEGYESAVIDLQKMIPGWKPAPRTNHNTEAERAEDAACGVAASIGLAALLGHRGKMPDEDSKSEGELAVAVAYAQLIYTAITAHLKDEGINLEMKPAAALVVDIAYLPEDFRSRCFHGGLKMAIEILQNHEENVARWRDSLFRVVGFYLLLGARRNPELETDVQKAIVTHSLGLYNALGK